MKPLTPAETNVLHTINTETAHTHQLAIIHKVTERRIRAIVKAIKSKGYLSEMKSQLKDIPPNFHGIRLHGMELSINILYKDDRYKKIIESSNLPEIAETTLKLNKDHIELYVLKSFYADDVHKATHKAMDYLSKLFNVIENEYKIIIRKSRSQNIKIVNAHYAEIHNEIATELNFKREKLRIYAGEDGKLCFLIDNSFNLDEFEAVHPITAKQDMGQVKNHFLDIRDKDHLPLSEVSAVCAANTLSINQALSILTTLTSSQQALTGTINAMLPKKEQEHITPDTRYNYFG